jgi:nucleoside-diphosphate-sugar epimerase
MDTVNGFIEIANSQNTVGEVTNIGMNAQISMIDLAHKLTELMKEDVKFQIEDSRIRPKSSEVERLCCDNRKIIQNTEWKPRFNLDSGLRETIRWFNAHKDLYKPDMYIV